MNIFEKILEALRNLFPGVPLSDVDLTAELDKKAEGTGLDWKSSVVDFLNLLGIDSSKKNRAALAVELGISADLKEGSAEKNEALRLAVFRKLAESSGNILPSLLY